MFGNIGPTEMIFLMIILLLIFGAKRLPELGSGLGKGIREFKKSMREINSEIDRPNENAQVPPPPVQRPAVPSSTETQNKENV
jgi:sec-independent protein translocase protein TatA